MFKRYFGQSLLPPSIPLYKRLASWLLEGKKPYIRVRLNKDFTASFLEDGLSGAWELRQDFFGKAGVLVIEVECLAEQVHLRDYESARLAEEVRGFPLRDTTEKQAKSRLSALQTDGGLKEGNGRGSRGGVCERDSGVFLDAEKVVENREEGGNGVRGASEKEREKRVGNSVVKTDFDELKAKKSEEEEEDEKLAHTKQREKGIGKGILNQHSGAKPNPKSSKEQHLAHPRLLNCQKSKRLRFFTPLKYLQSILWRNCDSETPPSSSKPPERALLHQKSPSSAQKTAGNPGKVMFRLFPPPKEAEEIFGPFWWSSIFTNTHRPKRFPVVLLYEIPVSSPKYFSGCLAFEKPGKIYILKNPFLFWKKELVGSFEVDVEKGPVLFDPGLRP